MTKHIHRIIKNHLEFLPYIFAVIGGIYFAYGYFEHYQAKIVLEQASQKVNEIGLDMSALNNDFGTLKQVCSEMKMLYGTYEKIKTK